MKETLFEKIDRYLNRELSPEEQQLFESELETNEELASAFILYKTIEAEMSGIQQHSAQEAALKKSLQQLNASYFKHRENEGSGIVASGEDHFTGAIDRQPVQDAGGNVRRINMRKGWMAAAVTIGIIITSATWYLKSTYYKPQVVVKDEKTDSRMPGSKPDTARWNEKIRSDNLTKRNKDKTKDVENKENIELNGTKRAVLFAKNFKPDTAPENKEGPLEDAFDYYQSKDYKNAITAFESADLRVVLRGQETDRKTLSFYAHYYKAQSYIAESNAVKAIPELQKAVAQSPSVSLQLSARWYLALAYLKAGDIKNTEKLLRQISASRQKTAYKSKADALLNELKP